MLNTVVHVGNTAEIKTDQNTSSHRQRENKTEREG